MSGVLAETSRDVVQICRSWRTPVLEDGALVFPSPLTTVSPEPRPKLVLQCQEFKWWGSASLQHHHSVETATSGTRGAGIVLAQSVRWVGKRPMP